MTPSWCSPIVPIALCLLTSAATASADDQVPKVGSDCSLAAATPIALDAPTAWEVSKAIRMNDRVNLGALMNARKVLILGSKALARVLENDRENLAQRVRLLAPLGEGQVRDAIRYQDMIGFEGWVPMSLCR